MELSEQVRTLKKSGRPCLVHYSKKLTAEGVITDYTTGAAGRVWVKTRMGEYSIPLTDVRRIDEMSAMNG